MTYNSRPIMVDGLPDFIQPLRLAEAAATVQGLLDLATLERVAADCGPQSGSVTVNLRFGKDDEDRPYFVTQVSTVLKLSCRRCLEDVMCPVDSSTSLAIVSDDMMASRLPERYEPLVVADEPIRLADLIEDELLLAMPTFAVHPGEACTSRSPAVQEAVFESQRESPFAVLDVLKKRGRK